MYGYNIFKAVIITAFNYVIFLKVSGWSEALNKKIIYGTIYVIVFSVILWRLSACVEEPYKSLLIVVFSAVFFKAVLKELYVNLIIYVAISSAVSHMLYLLTTMVSLFITFILYWFCNGGIEEIWDVTESIAWGTALLALVMEILLVASFISIKISGLGKSTTVNIGIPLSGIVFLFYGLLRQGVFLKKGWILFIAGIVLSAAGLMNCFRTESIITYNNKVRELIEEKLKSELRETQNINDYLERAAHRDTKRLPAYHMAVEEIINSTPDGEGKNKASRLLKELRTAEQEQAYEVICKLRKEKILPSTGMVLLDNVFLHMIERAANKDIDFDLIVGGNIKGITGIIPQTKLETLAADLIENAIIATVHGDDEYKSILVYLWVSNGVYELRVDENGQRFEAEVFNRLGKRRITTHEDAGGSGIGFMTIFETLHLCDASLIIVERPPLTCRYFKSVAVRFDGKRQKIINSYRWEDIVKTNDGSWIVEDFNKTPWH